VFLDEAKKYHVLPLDDRPSSDSTRPPSDGPT